MYYIGIAGLCVLSLLIIRHIFRVMRAGKITQRIKDAGLKVRVATFARLEARYKSKYRSQAPVLATAIANELFSDVSPDNSPAKMFSETHKDVIEEELTKLSDDKDLLSMTHLTLSQEIGVRHAYGTTAEQIEETFNKLERYALLVPVEGILIDKFEVLANEFFNSNTNSFKRNNSE